jgi:hypothetical protein
MTRTCKQSGIDRMVWIRCIYGWDLEEAQQTCLTGMQAVRELEDFSDGDYSSGGPWRRGSVTSEKIL